MPTPPTIINFSVANFVRFCYCFLQIDLVTFGTHLTVYFQETVNPLAMIHYAGVIKPVFK